jgi:hypothetical protein
MPDPTNDKQKLPDNCTDEGLSKGKQTGPVRPTEDAHREKGDEKRK